MMSLTSVCAPKPTARPMMPAPVSTGVMSTSSSRSTIRIGGGPDQDRRRTAATWRRPYAGACAARSVLKSSPSTISCSAFRITEPRSDWRQRRAGSAAGCARRSRVSHRVTSSGCRPTVSSTPARSRAGKASTSRLRTNVTRRTALTVALRDRLRVEAIAFDRAAAAAGSASPTSSAIADGDRAPRSRARPRLRR